MKTIKVIFTLVCALALSWLCSCEDNRTQYMDEFDSMVYFRNGGEQPLTLYTVGENPKYKIPICKSGTDLSLSAKVRIVPMDQQRMDIYNMANATGYVQMPEDCYEFLTETEFSFASLDPYQVAVVELKIDRIREVQRELEAGQRSVLALQVYSTSKVSYDINRLIIIPEIEVPVVSFSTKGVEEVFYTPDDAEVNEVSSRLVVNMSDSQIEWNFDCTLEALGQEWLDEYNAQNDTDYNLLPENNFTLPEVISFQPGSASASFDISIDRRGWAPFESFALPLRLASCTKPELDIDESVYIILGRLNPTTERITLTVSQLSSPYTLASDGAGLSGLIDGDTEAQQNGSYWHTIYSASYGLIGDPIYGYYVDIKLNSPLNVVKFSYMTRHNNSNGCPTLLRVGVSNDGSNWRLIGEYASSQKAQKAWDYLPVMYDFESFTYIRFGIPSSVGGDMTVQQATSAFTALGELVLDGATL